MSKRKLATVTDINAHRLKNGLPVYTNLITLANEATIGMVDDQQIVDSNDNAPFFRRLRKHLESTRSGDE